MGCWASSAVFLLVKPALTKEFLVSYFDLWVETNAVQLELCRQKASVRVSSRHTRRSPESWVFGDFPERPYRKDRWGNAKPDATLSWFCWGCEFRVVLYVLFLLFLLFKRYFRETRLMLLSLPNVMNWIVSHLPFLNLNVDVLTLSIADCGFIWLVFTEVIQTKWGPVKERNVAYGGKTLWRHRERMAAYKPRREISESTNRADTSTSNFWPPEL